MKTQHRTEIEVKFRVPDRETLIALQAEPGLGEFRLESLGLKEMTDRYLDGAGHPLLKAGYACRLRLEGQAQTLSLKSLTPPEDGVHRRREIEVVVESDQPATWPESEAKTLVQQIMGDAPLQPLFTLQQSRYKYHAWRNDRPVLEISLDEVTHDQETYFELEAEVLDQGTEADLDCFVETVQRRWNLPLETRSKFERAYAACFNQSKAESPHIRLSDAEQALLEKIAKADNNLLAKRALIILMSDGGTTPANIAKEVEVSPRTVRRWRQRFEAERLAIFPASLLSGEELPALDRPASVVKSEARPAKDKKRQKNSVTYKQKTIGLQPADTLAEAGRKVLGYHFARLLKYEPGTRSGQDIEALHDMRVTTRRMRAAFRVFGPAFTKKVMKPLLTGLKQTGQALGPVRDLDVFMEKLQLYQHSLPPAEQAGLQPLFDIWQAKRAEARQTMLMYLDSDQYLQFKQSFRKFVKTRGKGAKAIPDRLPPAPSQLRHIVPGLVYTYYEEVRAYETILDKASIETLHQLRISFKGLRYTLEFLHEVLGEERDLLIKEVKAMQDYLGELHDADVAANILREFLANWETGQLHLPLAERQNPAQIANYLNANLNDRHRLVVSFPEAWEKFNRPEIRQGLARAISVL